MTHDVLANAKKIVELHRIWVNTEVVLEGDPALSRSYLAKRALVSPYHHDKLSASMGISFYFVSLPFVIS